MPLGRSSSAWEAETKTSRENEVIDTWFYEAWKDSMVLGRSISEQVFCFDFQIAIYQGGRKLFRKDIDGQAP